MKLLALDTSTELCSVALALEGEFLVREAMAGNRHSELLLPMLDGLLAEAGLRLDDLDGLAFGMGPGSFTGLRIGCGVAQGLAFGTGLPVLGVITLEAMALAAQAERVVACIDARMREVYAAAYRCSGGALRAVQGPAVLPPDALGLPDESAWIGCGTGFAAYPGLLAGRLAEVRADLHPHAREIARLALPRFLAGEGKPAATAEPYYLRDKVALKRSER